MSRTYTSQQEIDNYINFITTSAEMTKECVEIDNAYPDDQLEKFIRHKLVENKEE